jgi:hypothetical protein
MPESRSPGVFTEEFENGAKPIEAVATSTAVFLGETERGPMRPTLVTSWEDFRRTYGEFSMPTRVDRTLVEEALPLAVRAFFDNGGQRVFVSRVVKRPIIAGDAGLARSAEVHGGFRWYAKGPGSWGNRVFLQLASASSEGIGTTAPFRRYHLRTFYWDKEITAAEASSVVNPEPGTPPTDRPPAFSEEFDDLALDPTSPDYVVERLDAASALVDVTVEPPGTALEAPAFDKGDLIPLWGGTDGADVDATDYDGESAGPEPRDSSWGLTALAEPLLEDVALVYAPRALEFVGLAEKLTAHCQKNRRFLVVDAKPNEADAGTLDPRSGGGMRATQDAAFYYPWYWALHPKSAQPVKHAPGGAVVGIYARSDSERGVWKAPANEEVRGAVDLEYDVDKRLQDKLHPRGVNVLRRFPGRGIRVWGARTLSSDALFKYVNVRRLFLFLESSIYRGVQWVVFEPNNEQLWARVRQAIAQFLHAQWRAGALMGRKQEEAFFVRADRTTMTQDDIDNGRLIVLIGIAPVKPAEFVIFRFAQSTATANG